MKSIHGFPHFPVYIFLSFLFGAFAAHARQLLPPGAILPEQSSCGYYGP